MKIIVQKVLSPEDLAKCFEIRKTVFVIEQEVDETEEYDEFEQSAVHYLATDELGLPLGTCRWRKTDNGVKLERFAVLTSYRDQKVGKALLSECLAQIPLTHKKLYLHAQVQAIPFYEKAGFKRVGQEFVEANIKHYTMELWRE